MPFDKSGSAAASRPQRSFIFGFRMTTGVIISSLLGSVSFAAHQMSEPPAVESQASADNAVCRLTLIADGEAKQVDFKPGETLAAVLAAQKFSLGALDRCSAPLASLPANSATVTISRVRVETTTQRTPIPFPSKQFYNPTLSVGTKSVKRAGKPGERVCTFLSTFVDNKLTSQVKKSEHVVPAVPQFEVLGTRGMTLASRGFFGGRRMIEMVATGYGPGGNGKWGQQTASGLKPGFGVVAVDPRFIPLGTRLYIEGYGYAVAGDTGGAIKGNRIDLGRDTDEEAEADGRKKVRVLILN